MRITYTRPTSPTINTFAQYQATLRLTTADEETYVLDLDQACTEYAEQALSSSLLTRSITATFYGWNRASFYYPAYGWGLNEGNKLILPRGPVQSITSITDANSQTITAYQWEAAGLTDWLRIQQSYTAPLVVVYVAGYGADASYVPSDIKMAIRTHVAALFENRESVADRTILPVPHSLESFYSLRRRSSPVG